MLLLSSTPDQTLLETVLNFDYMLVTKAKINTSTWLFDGVLGLGPKAQTQLFDTD